MTVRGHIENGTVVLDERVDLPEGARVRIEIEDRADLSALHPELRRICGILADVEDLDEAKLDALHEKHLR